MSGKHSKFLLLPSLENDLGIYKIGLIISIPDNILEYQDRENSWALKLSSTKDWFMIKTE